MLPWTAQSILSVTRRKFMAHRRQRAGAQASGLESLKSNFEGSEKLPDPELLPQAIEVEEEYNELDKLRKKALAVQQGGPSGRKPS